MTIHQLTLHPPVARRVEWGGEVGWGDVRWGGWSVSIVVQIQPRRPVFSETSRRLSASIPSYTRVSAGGGLSVKESNRGLLDLNMLLLVWGPSVKGSNRGLLAINIPFIVLGGGVSQRVKQRSPMLLLSHLLIAKLHMYEYLCRNSLFGRIRYQV